MKLSKIWPFSLWYKEWMLTVYWTEDIIGADGIVHKRGKSNTYRMKKISKLTHTHIKGKDVKGQKVEIKTKKPMDYRIQEVKGG